MPNKVERICANCHKSFDVLLKEVTRGKGRCCSLGCAAAIACLNRNQKGPNNNNWRGGITASRKKRYKEANPEKHAAHLALTNAIRRGILKKQPCEKCGSDKTEGHHDDYTLPLSVRWLCRAHHLEAHAGRFG